MTQGTCYIPVSVEERLPTKMDKFFCINNKNPEFPDEEFQYELTFYPASSYIDGKPRWIDTAGLVNHQREFGNVPKGAYEFGPSHWLEKKEAVIVCTKEEVKDAFTDGWEASRMNEVNKAANAPIELLKGRYASANKYLESKGIKL